MNVLSVIPRRLRRQFRRRPSRQWPVLEDRPVISVGEAPPRSDAVESRLQIDGAFKDGSSPVHYAYAIDEPCILIVCEDRAWANVVPMAVGNLEIVDRRRLVALPDDLTYDGNTGTGKGRFP